MMLELNYPFKWFQRSKNQFKRRSSNQKNFYNYCLTMLINFAHLQSLSENFSCLLLSLVCLNYGLPVYKWDNFISFSGKAAIIYGNSILLLIVPIKKELPGFCKSDCLTLSLSRVSAILHVSRYLLLFLVFPNIVTI